jgi:hypothetical protein
MYIFKKTSLYLLIFFCMLSFYAWGAFTIKKQIFPYGFLKKITVFNTDRNNFDESKFWAKKIAQGGFLLHFRHAQREKWNDVTAFDAYELFNKIDAENSDFYKATCLTDQGVQEAKLIGEVFKINKVKIDKVISSPSCRAKQTARYAFGKIDQVDNSLLHRTAIVKDQWPQFSQQLKN